MRRPIRVRRAILLSALLATGIAPVAGAAPAADVPWRAKLDPRLVAAAEQQSPVAEPVWVEFADKGERGPADVAARLAAAERALTPRARARRERAQVWPRVDYLDLPVHGPYVAALAARGFQTYGASRWFNRVAVRIPAARLAELASLPFVRALAPVEKARLGREPIGEVEPLDAAARIGCPGNCTNPAPVSYGLTAAEMTQLNIAALHDSGYVGTGVTICVLDDGFQYYRAHEALAGILVPPGFTRDFVWGVPNLPDSSSSPGYGWHGSTTLACVGGNKPGVYLGSAFGATFALGRTEIDSVERQVEMTNWAMAAEWADSLGADIISSSLGYNTFDVAPNYTYADLDGHTTVITRAAEIAAAKGILVVNSAGNIEPPTYWNRMFAPADANGDSVLAVGAVDQYGQVANFSCIGPTADGRIKPDLMARGVSDPLPNVRNKPLNPTGYFNANGTSFSAPLIAGFAACLMQARPTLRPVDIVQAMRQSADRATSPDNSYGYGIPDGGKALLGSQLGVAAVTSKQIRIVLAGPNPIHPGQSAGVRFAAGPDVPAGARARVNVYDAAGRRVRELWCADAMVYDRWIGASWNGLDSDGRRVRPGLYLVSLEVGHLAQSVRLVVLR